ncbi:MAG: D-alanyl-D-alanine carboxypeptidase [Lachnospiraceae bacterium]|nr:D-alanyl-D-alanine carboxypeptidase [Lachnospiraceae bacterium]
MSKPRFFSVLTVLLLVLSVYIFPLPAAGAETESAAPEPPPSDIIPTNGVEGWPKSMNMSADYVCLMDKDTGVILLEKGMDTPTPPASLTKVMTTLLAIEKGDPEAYVTMTGTGVEYAVSGSANLFTQVGETFQLKDMLYGVMLKSANDMATQVGEYIGGGDLSVFVSMMNERAKELGCTGTTFVNACGMPAEGHKSTAHDMALIMREALKSKRFRKIIKTKKYVIPATEFTEQRTVENHQPFLMDPDWKYKGTIGGKSGYTDLARNCLITCVKRDGRTLIAVVMHDIDIIHERTSTKQILDFGFSNFENAAAPVPEDELLSGGTLTVPQGTDPASLETEETEETDADGKELLVTRYYLGGRYVGEAVRDKAVVEKKAEEARKAEEAEREEEARKAEEAKKAAEAAAKESAEAAASSPAAVSDAAGEMDAGNAGKTAGAGKTRFLGRTMSRSSVLFITGLAISVLFGLILIILSILFSGKRRKE